MRIRKVLLQSILFLAVMFCFSGLAQASDLVNLLMSQLGVTQHQAAGGAGAIFRTAKENLEPDEFSQIEQAVPEAGSLIHAAPKLSQESSGMGGLGSLTSMAKNVSPKLGSTAELAQSFDKLGLEKQMMGKFTDIVVDYCKQKGGGMVSSLMQKAIGF